MEARDRQQILKRVLNSLSDTESKVYASELMPLFASAFEEWEQEREQQEKIKKRDLIKNQVLYDINPETRQMLSDLGFDADQMEDPDEFNRALHKVLEISYDDDKDDPEFIIDRSDRPIRAPYISVCYDVDDQLALEYYEKELERSRSLQLLGTSYEQWLEHKKRVALNRALNSYIDD